MKQIPLFSTLCLPLVSAVGIAGEEGARSVGSLPGYWYGLALRGRPCDISYSHKIHTHLNQTPHLSLHLSPTAPTPQRARPQSPSASQPAERERVNDRPESRGEGRGTAACPGRAI